ncbi:MAG: hypothetical protein JWN10_1462 [Solirubrobacterales bacterium]|nr:hypothetical protein [Solirubrobacterales bacterium]
MTRAAVWVRVSTAEQNADNQVPAIERFAEHRGYEIVKRYALNDSAWNGGKDGGEYKATLTRALEDAHRGEFEVLIVWALDRLTREGAEGLLRLLRQFDERSCTVLSVQEDWLSGSPTIRDVLIAFAGWNAQQESNRRSERIKAALAERKAKGLPVGGRKPGAKDRTARRTEGYVQAWARRRGAEAR